jgi:glycosyltransferase involved in cell wall biosynthesis
MQLTAVMIVFNGDHVLEQSLSSIYNFVDEIVIAEGPVEYWKNKGMTYSTDRTISILKNFNDPKNKLKYISSTYKEKDEQFQAALNLIKTNPDYIIQVDSDEVWTEESLSGLKKLLNEKKPISVGVHSNTFVGGFNRVISGFEEKTDNFLRVFKWEKDCKFLTHRPPTILYKDGKKTCDDGHVNSDDAKNYYGISMCHYSYVWPSQVKSKIEYYKSKVSKENCIPDFYFYHWLPWIKAKTITEKWEIEKKILGLHEFKPEIRGPAFTKPFTGIHPRSIIETIDILQKRIEEEIE